MCYISLAIPVGPWIEPTMVLVTIALYRLFKGFVSSGPSKIAITVVGSSVGGIVATGLGFSFPALFFLDPELFNQLMKDPFYFIFSLALFTFAAGLFGFAIADYLEEKFIEKERLPFPVGQLVYKMIAAQNHVKKAAELALGFITTMSFCLAQEGLGLPKEVKIVGSSTFGGLKIPMLSFNIFPVLWAIGFVTGHVIAVPLFVGALAQLIFGHMMSGYFFPNLLIEDFVLAFGSGMVLASAVYGITETPKFLWNGFLKLSSQSHRSALWQKINHYECIVVLSVVFGTLTFFGFSPLSQIYLVIFTFICTYAITKIAGRIGIAHLGRFATFVMVPGMFIFNWSFLEITLTSCFVEVAGGVATDILFGRKMASLAGIPNQYVKKYQLFGLVVSCLTVGLIFWLLINHFELGSADLFAQKAKARALLVFAPRFNNYLLAAGCLFTYVLKLMKINRSLVLGGLLMPINVSFGLIFGALIAHFTKSREEWFPFWSGVFASHSIWMLLKTLF